MSTPKSLVCPYCFKSMTPREIEFRCTNESDNCIKHVDPNLSEFLRKKTEPMGRTFRPVSTDSKGRVVEFAECPDCRTTTTAKICPHCHNDLPRTFGECETFIISVVGVKESGKSHFISVLIDSLVNTLGPNMDCDVQPINDATLERYRQNFYDPVFKHKETIHATRSAQTDIQVKMPLVYTMTFLKPKTFLNTTPILNLIFGKEPKPRKIVTLALYDAAGEDLNSQSVMQREYKYLFNSAGIILLADPLQFAKVRENYPEELLPNENTNIMDLVSRLTNMIRETKHITMQKKIDTPIAVTISKSDAITSFLSPSSVILHTAAANESDLDESIRHSIHDEVVTLLEDWTSRALPLHFTANYKTVSYFASSAIGTNPHGREDIADIRPHRIGDPLLWLMEKNKIITPNSGMNKVKKLTKEHIKRT